MSTKKGPAKPPVNILGDRGPPTAAKQSKQSVAQKYFQSNTNIPAAPSFLDQNGESVTNGRYLPKPLHSDETVYDPNDPMARIEMTANKIDTLVKNFEQNSEEAKIRMLQELDSSFQTHGLAPSELIQESKNIVDGLITQNKELKKNQSTMLADLNQWLTHEEKALQDVDDTFKSTVSAEPIQTIPTSDEMVRVLNSQTGTTQDRISRVLQIHSDIVGHAYMNIRKLEKKEQDQAKLIQELEAQRDAAAPKKGRKLKSAQKDDPYKQLEVAQARITTQDEQIKGLNKRIEELVGSSVMISDKSGDKDKSEEYMQAHKLLTTEMQLEKTNSELNSVRDTLFKLKQQLQACNGEKQYLESQATTLKEKLELERSKYDALQRQMLQTSYTSAAPTDKSPDLMKEIARLTKQLDEEKERAHEEYNDRLAAVRREYEVREMELKKTNLYSMIEGSHQEVFETLQKQHADEIAMIKAHHEEEVNGLKKDFQRRLQENQKNLNEQLYQLQGKLAAAVSGDAASQIEEIQRISEQREIEIKKVYTEKLEQTRNSLQGRIAELEDEILKKEAEIERFMTSAIQASAKPSVIVEEKKETKPEVVQDPPIEKGESITDYAKKAEQRCQARLAKQKKELDDYWQGVLNDTVEKQKGEALDEELGKAKDRIAELEGQVLALQSPEKNQESEDKFESLKQELAEQVKKTQQMESLKKKLEVENEILQKSIAGGSSDMYVIDLAQHFAEQTEELERIKKELADAQSAYTTLQSTRMEKVKSKKSLPKMMEMVTQELFFLVPPPDSKPPEKIAVPSVPHVFRKHFEINTSIEPKRTKLVLSSQSQAVIRPVNSRHLQKSFTVAFNSADVLDDVLKSPLAASSSLGFEVGEDATEESEKSPTRRRKRTAKAQIALSLSGTNVTNISFDKSIQFDVQKCKVFEVFPPEIKIRSFMWDCHLSIDPTIKNPETPQPKTPMQRGGGGIVRSRILGVFPQSSTFIEPMAPESQKQLETSTIACQANLRDDSLIKPNHYDTQPPIEIFGLNMGVVSPPDPVILDPYFAKRRQPKEQSQRPELILSKGGEVIEVPPAGQVTSETNPLAVSAVAKFTIETTNQLSKNLQLVMSEISSVTASGAPESKENIQLEVKKDSIISEMKERITELEQMITKTSTKEVKISEAEVLLDSYHEHLTHSFSDQIHIEATEAKPESAKQICLSFEPNVSAFSVASNDNNLSVAVETAPISIGNENTPLTIEFQTVAQQSPKKSRISEPILQLKIEASPVSVENSVAVNIVTSKPKTPLHFENDSSQTTAEAKASLSIGQTSPSKGTTNADQTSQTAGQNAAITNAATSQNSTLFKQGISTDDKTAIQTTERATSAKVDEAQKERTKTPKAKLSISIPSITTFRSSSLKQMSVSSGEEVSVKPSQKSLQKVEIQRQNCTFEKVAIQTESRSSSPLFGTQSRLAIASKNQVDIQPVKQRVKQKLDATPVNIVQKDRTASMMATLQNQAEQISLLKKQLLQLQLAPTQPAAVANVQKTINKISEAITKSAEPVVVINENKEAAKVPSIPTQSNLRRAVETTTDLAQKILDKHANSVILQEAIASKINQTVKEISTNKEEESISKTLNNLAGQIGENVTSIKSGVPDQEELKKALVFAREELSKNDDYITSLQKEILNLKTQNPGIVARLNQIRNELTSIENGDPSNNQLFKTKEDAIPVLTDFVKHAKSDNLVQQANASTIVDSLLKAIEVADFPPIIEKCEELSEALEEKFSVKQASNQILDLQKHVFELQKLNQTLQAEKLVNQRDYTEIEGKFKQEIEQMRKTIENSDAHCAFLEGRIQSQLERQEAKQANEKEEAVRQLRGEIIAAQKLEAEREKDLKQANDKITDLEKEAIQVKEELQKAQEKYENLFSQASDTQTANQALKGRVEEIVMQSEIDANKAKTMEAISKEASKQLDDLTQQYGKMIGEREAVKRKLIEAEDKISTLQKELLQEASNKASARADVPKLIKIYQQKMEQIAEQLQRRGADIISYQARRAEDAKALVMMRRDNQRKASELKCETLRYESAKQENALLQKTIALRDETIRLMRREIERLRGLLSMQEPIKQVIRAHQREKLEKEAEIASAKGKVEAAERISNGMKGKDTKLENYFDGMVERRRIALARLEKERKEMAEKEAKSRLATLEAVSEVVRASELEIPEKTVLQFMPRPAPVQRLGQQQLLDEIRQAEAGEEVRTPDRGLEKTPDLNPRSYADTLKVLGALAGKRPQAELQEMLRNARHQKSVFPTRSTIKKPVPSATQIGGIAIKNLMK